MEELPLMREKEEAEEKVIETNAAMRTTASAETVETMDRTAEMETMRTEWREQQEDALTNTDDASVKNIPLISVILPGLVLFILFRKRKNR